MPQTHFTIEKSLSFTQRQNDFIRYAHWKVYNHNIPEYYSYFPFPGANAYERLSTDQKAQVDSLYTEGFFVLKVLQMSFQDFILSLTEAKSFNPAHLAYEARRDVIRHQNYLDFRQSSRYVKRPHHKVKELSEEEIAKNNWRKKKGFNKKRIEKSPYGSSKHLAKKASNKSYRRWVNQRIKDEDFDAFYQTKDIHFFNDRDWD